jgi:hypothetical protein
VTGFGEEVGEFLGGGAGGQTAGADVGNAIAGGVGQARLGSVGEVSAEAVDGAEAGSFAEEHEAELGVEQSPDFILERDSAVRDDDQGREGPVAYAEQREQGGQKRRNMGGGEAGEAVGDDDDEIAGSVVALRGAGGQLRATPRSPGRATPSPENAVRPRERRRQTAPAPRRGRGRGPSGNRDIRGWASCRRCGRGRSARR